MVHKTRRWMITEVATLEELAPKLREHSWCLCSGFRYKDLLFLNDAFSPDGAQEYAVVRLGEGVAPSPPAERSLPEGPVVVARTVADLLTAVGGQHRSHDDDDDDDDEQGPLPESPSPSGEVLRGRQIESLTVSWYESTEELLAEFKGLESGALGLSYGRVAVQTHPRQTTCGHCA